jgi:uncharacterized membrane-anchored protein YitT (DUF2179 family)
MLKAATANLRRKARHPVLNELFKLGAIITGAILVAVGLEQFLVPNGFLDGGVVGVSIILTNFFDIPLGVFIGVVNIPFLIIALKYAGFKSAARTAVGIVVLSASTVFLHHFEPLTEEFVLALGYGGVLLGVGVGLALRYGGALDGTEILAVTLATRTKMSVDQIILIINFFIFAIAAFVFGPERAMASFLLFYVVVTPIIKKVIDGGNSTKVVQIMSSKHAEVAEAIHESLNRKVIFIDAHKDDINDSLKVVNTFCARAEEAILVEAVDAVDPDAIIVISDAANIHGSIFTKNKHH